MAILKELLIPMTAMQKSECIQLLRSQYLKDQQQKNNLSKLTNEARKDQKTDCLTTVGGFSEIRSLLNGFDQPEKEHSAPSATKSSACEQKLITTFRKDYTQKNNLSKLTNESWGSEKTSCLQEIGGYNQLSLFLKNIEANYTEQYEAKLGETSAGEQAGIINTSVQKTQTTPTATIQSGTVQSGSLASFQEEFAIAGQIGSYVGYGLIALICIGLIVGIIKNTLRYIYSFYHTRRMSFIKVLLPKSDGKSDREQEKEIAKDMKEKI